MKFDLMNSIGPVKSIAPIVVADNTAQVGDVLDGQGFSSLTYLIQAGLLADAAATFAVLLEHDDLANFSTAVAVPDTDLLGTEALASFDQAADGKVFKLGYVGSKRYTRLTITPTGNAGSAPISAVAIFGHPNLAPTVNPPA